MPVTFYQIYKMKTKLDKDSGVTTKSLYLFIYLFESFFIILITIFKSNFPCYTEQNSFYLHAIIKGDWKFGNLIKICLESLLVILNKAIFKTNSSKNACYFLSDI